MIGSKGLINNNNLNIYFTHLNKYLSIIYIYKSYTETILN